MSGTWFYGAKGRLVSGVAFIAGVLSGAVSAAQQTNLISIFPQSYNKYFGIVALVSLFFTAFNERLQGGASKPEVRAAAAASDKKNEKEAMNQ
jgi:hypothetical protein